MLNPLKRQVGQWSEGQCQNQSENPSLIHRPFYFHKHKAQYITYLLPIFCFSSEAIVRLYYTATTCFRVMQEIHLTFVNFTCHLPALPFLQLSPAQCRALPSSCPNVCSSQANLGHSWGHKPCVSTSLALAMSHQAFTFENSFFPGWYRTPLWCQRHCKAVANN